MNAHRKRSAHRWWGGALFVVVAVLAMPLSACGDDEGGGGSTPSQDPAALEGVTWILTQYIAADGTQQIVNVGVNAEFDGSTISGNSGCNTYSGSYTATGSDISFGPIATTQMACAANEMAVETQYLKLLSEAATFEISGRSMSMSNADGTPTLGFMKG